MHSGEQKQIRVAILDLYEQQANQGMRCLREILHQFGLDHDMEIHTDEFEVRVKNELPDLSYDIYISSGGPGSPLESEGNDWENKYFHWLRQVEQWNQDKRRSTKKYVFLICHSFQLACRQYGLAKVCRRKSTAFGVFPVHILPSGKKEAVFAGLDDPFYSVDSRDYQVISPDSDALVKSGGSILAIEKERPHVPLERAIMAVRFNEYMIGTQFHPEADPIGMSLYLQREDKKQTVISEHGEEKWKNMLEHLGDPDKIRWTYSHVIPNFLKIATRSLVES